MTSPNQLDDHIGATETANDFASPTISLGLSAVLDKPASSDALSQPFFPVAHWLLFKPTASMSELGEDGHPRLGGFIPDLGLPRRMWAGSEITYHHPIQHGQRVDRTSTIESITPKHGSSGKLCFVTLKHEVSTDEGPALTELQTLVYREAAQPSPIAPTVNHPPRPDSEVPSDWDWGSSQRLNTVMLFRYSALTFNAHRIHYDLPYATRQEGYPGVVAHGPLMATLLVDAFLQEHPGAELTSYKFSARAPIFAGEQVHLVGKTDSNDGQRAELAVIGPDGKPAVTGAISFR